MAASRMWTRGRPVSSAGWHRDHGRAPGGASRPWKSLAGALVCGAGHQSASVRTSGITYVNTAAERIFGCRAGELIGRELAEAVVPRSLARHTRAVTPGTWPPGQRVSSTGVSRSRLCVPMGASIPLSPDRRIRPVHCREAATADSPTCRQPCPAQRTRTVGLTPLPGRMASGQDSLCGLPDPDC